MYAHLEENAMTRSDCPIQCLSWMGKVPDSVPDEDGWKLNRASYYQEGWLATGNTGGIVGVTFTAGHSKKLTSGDGGPPRSNFNLRGHRSEVVLVKWNEPYQKLATCDTTGVIFVWIKHEGRWSIELINDRSSQVTDFTWSHDGRMALICYRDGFVLVGSVAGQRYWSSMLNLDGNLITTGVWSHDDQKVLFGTTGGQLIVMSSSGAMLTQVCVQDMVEICSLCWACEKFYLSETDNGGSVTAGNGTTSNRTGSSLSKPPLLALGFRTGAIYLMSTYDDVCPKVIHTGLTGVRMEWSNDGEILAVAGFIRLPNLECRNEVRFYNRQAVLKYRIHIPHQGKPVSHLTWGHNDRRLFVAVGCHVYTLWVTKQVAPLQFLCKRRIQERLKDEASANKLPLPVKIQGSLKALFCPTIRGYIPQAHKLREFVCIPPAPTERLHCTMIRQGEECSGGHYTLYLEYLGGLIPLLKGKRASKIRPEFIIFDPKIKTSYNNKEDDSVFVSSDSSLSDSDSDFDLMVEGCGSPRMQRRKKSRRLKDRYERRDSMGIASNRPIDELMYDDNLPEDQKLVEVTSNIWGTRFKLHGLASFLPEDLGHVLYKTSLLHLQPRQMTITIVEVSPDLPPQERDPGYNPNHFSESEDEVIQVDGERVEEVQASGFRDSSVAISPETPSCPYPIPALNSPQRRPDPPKGLIQTTAGLNSPLLDRSEHLAPLEIRSLDASPPQRRSPSFKPRALSPAEHVVPFTSNSLVTGTVTDGSHQTITVQHGVSSDILKNKDSADSVVTVVTDSAAPPSSPCARRPLDCITLSSDSQSSRSPDGNNSSSSSSYTNIASMVPSVPPRLPRWADKACHELKYIDEDSDDTRELVDRKEAVYCNVGELSAREIMSSMQMLHQLEQQAQESSSSSSCLSTGCGDLGTLGTTSVLTQVQSLAVFEPQKKRVVLSKPPERSRSSRLKDLAISSLRTNTGCLEVSCGTTRCKPGRNHILECSRSRSTSPTPSRRPLNTNNRTIQNKDSSRRGSFDLCLTSTNQDRQAANQSVSLPTSPVHKVLQKAKSSKSRTLSCHRGRLQSSGSGRRQRYSRGLDSSDDEMVLNGDNVTTSENYRNLETFQKAQLSRKLRRVRSKSDADMDRRPSPYQSPKTSPLSSPHASRKRHFVMHNKAPMWNENSQVYQLDFGGRVTQESAKNFQIEFRGKQVMQFGRIDSNAYTLDFQYPFSAVQAFAVALANVTQRLK